MTSLEYRNTVNQILRRVGLKYNTVKGKIKMLL